MSRTVVTMTIVVEVDTDRLNELVDTHKTPDDTYIDRLEAGGWYMARHWRDALSRVGLDPMLDTVTATVGSVYDPDDFDL